MTNRSGIGVIFAEAISRGTDFIEFLDYLAKQEVPFLLVNYDSHDAILERLDRHGLLQWFSEDRIISVSDFEKENQFSPLTAILARAAERLGLPSDRCLVITERRDFICSARAAGMGGIAFVGKGVIDYCNVPEHADRVIESFGELSIPMLRSILNLHPTAW